MRSYHSAREEKENVFETIYIKRFECDNGVRRMRRLTKRNEEGYAYFPQCFEETCCGDGCHIEPCEFLDQVCEKLAKYEDTEERGECNAERGSSQRTTIPETGKEKEAEKA